MFTLAHRAAAAATAGCLPAVHTGICFNSFSIQRPLHQPSPSPLPPHSMGWNELFLEGGVFSFKRKGHSSSNKMLLAGFFSRLLMRFLDLGDPILKSESIFFLDLFARQVGKNLFGLLIQNKKLENSKLSIMII